MKTYGQYKDSGVEWIGEIPDHWTQKTLKRLSTITLGKMLTDKDKGGFVKKPYLRSKNIQIEEVDVSDVKEMWFSPPELLKYLVKENDILVSEGGDVGRTNIWKNQLEECYLQNSVQKITMNEGYYPRYFFYHFQGHHFVGYFDSIVDRVSIPHLTKEKISEVLFVVPPLPEQQQIVTYLDQKTSQIDELIDKKTRKIELLKEYRTSLINQVVTKGLDPKVEMKDSGVEWIGEIPEGWDTSRVRYLTEDHRQGYYSSDPYDEEGLRLVRITDIGDDHKIDVLSSPFYNRPQDEVKDFVLTNGDFLFPRTGGVGRFGIVDFETPSIYGSFMIRFRFSDYMTSSLLRYFFESDLYLHQVLREIHGGVNKNVHVENIKNCGVLVPSQSEQQQIVSYLDQKTQEIDQSIETEEKKIEHLKEYRQSLISNVVTGKIDVRDNVLS